MCFICDRIDMIKNGINPWFVRELETGYVVIGDHQHFKGYCLFLCKEHKTELFHLDRTVKMKFLEEMSLVDDSRTATQIVESCIRKGYGRSRAKQMLYEKRIPKELWQEALEDYPDQSDAVSAYIQSRLSDRTDPKAVKRVIDALIRQGHSYGLIRRMLDLEDVLED